MLAVHDPKAELVGYYMSSEYGPQIVEALAAEPDVIPYLLEFAPPAAGTGNGKARRLPCCATDAATERCLSGTAATTGYSSTAADQVTAWCSQSTQ